MKRYLVAIHVNNLLLNMRGETGKYGFRTKKYIEADNEDQAEKRALGVIFNDSDLQRIIQNRSEDPPSVTVEDIQEVDRPIEQDPNKLKLNYYKEHEA